ncbi:YusU family protein [Anoxybacteroides tepidamans]|uniref:YusU family protein n=1 Tax=Anoxybacteroides tepidamans TaxID=265948 RepID=UPI00047F3999|nr:YusU family protein [Anoxybacillus tepidamans]
MNRSFIEQFDALLDKYTELLLGESNAELKEKVKVWILYSHIAKSMPALGKHWNELYPEAKEQVKEMMAEIKQLNEEKRNKA